VKPTAVMYNTLIRSYCDHGKLEVALQYRDQMVGSGVAMTDATYNSLVHALFKDGQQRHVQWLRK
jgi:pentatricopeptide repeat protein